MKCLVYALTFTQFKHEILYDAGYNVHLMFCFHDLEGEGTHKVHEDTEPLHRIFD
jgi:hypothetical protein